MSTARSLVANGAVVIIDIVQDSVEGRYDLIERAVRHVVFLTRNPRLSDALLANHVFRIELRHGDGDFFVRIIEFDEIASLHRFDGEISGLKKKSLQIYLVVLPGSVQTPQRIGDRLPVGIRRLQTVSLQILEQNGRLSSAFEPIIHKAAVGAIQETLRTDQGQ